MAPRRDKYRYGYLEAVISIAANLLLFGLKYWAGIVTGSIAIIADAWHTLSDSASSLVVLGSVRLAGRKPDRRHPFGHGRYQEIAAIFIAFILGIIAYEFFIGSIEKFRSRADTDFGLIAILVTAFSLVVKESMAQYAFWTYRKTGFLSLRADGWHHRSDALSSLVVLIGILLGKRFWWMDSVLGLIISLMLFYAVYEIIRGSVEKLLGEEPDKELMAKIHEIINRTAGSDIEPHHFHIHTYGDHSELTLHIRLNGKLDISAGHRIATRIENAVRNELEIETTIHVEPKQEVHG